MNGMKLNEAGSADAIAIETMEMLDRWIPSSADRVAVSMGLAADRDLRERPVCAFDGCTAGWSKMWRRSGRPMFEGTWGCSRACVRGLVEASVRREMEGAEGADAAASHQHRVPLGLVLLAQGLVTQGQLQQALAAQRRAGSGRIGEWLVKACGVDETKVTRGLGFQWQCPVLGMAGFDAARMALAMPAALRKLCGVAPLRVAGGRILYVAFDERVDAAAAFALERMSGLSVESGILPGAESAVAVEGLDRRSAVECREEIVEDREAMVDRVADALHKLQPVASKIVRLRDRYWMRVWLERGAIGKNGMLPATGEDVVDMIFRVGRKTLG